MNYTFTKGILQITGKCIQHCRPYKLSDGDKCKSDSSNRSRKCTGKMQSQHNCCYEKVQVSNDQEKALSERNSHSKNRGEKN